MTATTLAAEPYPLDFDPALSGAGLTAPNWSQ